MNDKERSNKRSGNKEIKTKDKKIETKTEDQLKKILESRRRKMRK